MFATYLHEENGKTTKPVPESVWFGNSYLHYTKLQRLLVDALPEYPILPLRTASIEDFGTVHKANYLAKLVAMSRDEPVDDPPRFSLECQGYHYCLPGYEIGLGGMMAAVDAFRDGTLRRAFTFALGGHHAFTDHGHGYCILNPLAAVARYAQTRGFNNVLIIDWHIHHGDGTQSIFEHDKSVHCLSIHNALDLYMAKVSNLESGFTGYASKVGHTNVPLLYAGFEPDMIDFYDTPTEFHHPHESLEAFTTALANIPFQPDLILVFAGCDSHHDDCGQDVTDWREDDFRTLTRAVLDLAEPLNCPVLSTQGGAYNFDSAVPTTFAHVDTLATYRM